MNRKQIKTRMGIRRHAGEYAVVALEAILKHVEAEDVRAQSICECLMQEIAQDFFITRWKEFSKFINDDSGNPVVKLSLENQYIEEAKRTIKARRAAKKAFCTDCEFRTTDGCGPGPVMMCGHPYFKDTIGYEAAIIQRDNDGSGCRIEEAVSHEYPKLY